MSVSTVRASGNMEMIAVAMNKRIVDEQGRAALSLLEASTQNVQQTNQLASSGSLGRNIDVYA